MHTNPQRKKLSILTTTLHTTNNLSDALSVYHTVDLLGLATGLALELSGRLVPGTVDHAELIDEELVAEMFEALGLERIEDLIAPLQTALEERHWEFAEAMAEFRAECGWRRSWMEAMFWAAGRVAANADLALAA